MFPDGTAFLDGDGRVLAADPVFRAVLRLDGDDATAALRTRADTAPELAAFLAGGGPEEVRIGDGADACQLRRVRGAAGGLLVHASAVQEGAPAHPLEYAMQAVALARLAGSLAHEVKNPLNAMALQLALLGDKIGTTSEALAAACDGNLASLKNQIGRVNEVVRRFLDVADPAPSGGFDAGSLLSDAVSLFAHEGRRRRVALACEVAAGGVRARGDAARVARLLLGLLWRALAGTQEGGKLAARAAAVNGEAVLSVEHGPAASQADPAFSWVAPVVAAAAEALGGRLEDTSGDQARVALVLPKERAL